MIHTKFKILFIALFVSWKSIALASGASNCSALLSDAIEPAGTETVIREAGGLSVHIENYRVWYEGIEVAMNGNQIRLVWHMLSAPARVFSPEELHQAAYETNKDWDLEGELPEEWARAYMTRVRTQFKKVGFDLVPLFVASKPTSGYRLLAEPTVNDLSSPYIQRGDLIISGDESLAFWKGQRINVSRSDVKSLLILSASKDSWIGYERFDNVYLNENQRPDLRFSRIRKKIKAIDPNFNNIRIQSGFVVWESRPTAN